MKQQTITTDHKILPERRSMRYKVFLRPYNGIIREDAPDKGQKDPYYMSLSLKLIQCVSIRAFWDLILGKTIGFPEISSFLAFIINNLFKRNLTTLLMVSCFVIVISGCNTGAKEEASAVADNETNTIDVQHQSSSTGGGQKTEVEEKPNATANSSATAKPNATANPTITTNPSVTAKPDSTTTPPVVNKTNSTSTPAPIAGTPITEESEPAANAQPPKQPQSLKVTLSIVGDASHGTILTETVYEFEKGNTVMDLLKRVTREEKIHMEFRGRGAMAYVEGIDNLYEFDQGAESGWIYSVNGKVQNKSAGSCTLTTGDTVKWEYTLEIGETPVDNGGDNAQSNYGDTGKPDSKVSAGGNSQC